MSKTLENLTKAFIGESQARNRYTFYAKIAKKEGFEKIAEIFSQTAEQEKQHAKWLFRLINQLKENDEEINVEASAPTVFSDTVANLKSAIEGEHYETSSMYPEFADIAEQEGHDDIARRLRAIARAEKHHEERYKKLLKHLEDDTMFKREEKVYWICRECGYIREGTEPPEECPSCSHPKGYFEKQCEDF